MDGGARIRPTEEELKILSPEFDERWKTYYADKPDKPVIVIATMAAYVGLNPAVPRGKYFSIAYFTVSVFYSICCSSISLAMTGSSGIYWSCSYHVWHRRLRPAGLRPQLP